MSSFRVKLVLSDIEGTTTSINFVKSVLFPHSFDNVENYLNANWDKDDVQKIVSDFKELSKEDRFKDTVQQDDKITDVQLVTKLARHIIENDIKIGCLKKLQDHVFNTKGLIWEEGYSKGKFKGHLYEDVPGAFQKWTSNGLKIYIYSSGSVWAQKLLFKNTEFGDMLPYIAGHFDTSIGHKQEKKSYENILKELNVKGDDVLFLTDIPKEAEAAKAAGITAVLLDRPGNAPLSDEDRRSYVVVQSFDELNVALSTEK